MRIRESGRRVGVGAPLRGMWLGVVLLIAASTTMGLERVAAQAPPAFMAEFEGQFGGSARKLVSLAEAMPASAYSWSPGEGVASVARVFMHIARYNYMYPHENMGRETPVPPAEYGRWEGEVSDLSLIHI